jgi:thiosulfate reductase cytochrome b subunit
MKNDVTKSPVSHPLWLRITHWLNAIAVILMIMSGWQIYNASPLFHFRFSRDITLGGWLAGGILWHFAAMWLLVANGLTYLAINLFTGRMQMKFFPVRIKELLHEFWLAATLRLSHQDLNHYNMVQKFAYLFVIADLIVIVCSGLVLWKSVQFPLLNTLLGGYDTARYIHFCGMALLVGFIAVHVLLVAIVPRTLLGMIRGRF